MYDAPMRVGGSSRMLLSCSAVRPERLGFRGQRLQLRGHDGKGSGKAGIRTCWLIQFKEPSSACAQCLNSRRARMQFWITQLELCVLCTSAEDAEQQAKPNALKELHALSWSDAGVQAA
mmetsp:Transcript_40239/g.93918  ORF Transcript_40239/g.93918 Transcript_40239/m.93918 type:complete len:119 (+) Transcript_40239:1209-1565(+)